MKKNDAFEMLKNSGIDKKLLKAICLRLNYLKNLTNLIKENLGLMLN